ncbi:MAG: hypothetical protein P4L56_03820 [Candidatus Sulfopaludibacter sp.]|nr:hypothetical protein [Candidatus Sulfopaludibacter sp.]
MDIGQMLQNMAERVSAGASVKNVYGEPVVVGDRTVLPAARVRYAFGGGGRGETSAGGGGGGRVAARPCGALEITPEGCRYISFGGQRRLCAAFAAGFLLGAAIVALRGPRRVEVVKRVAG